MGNVRIPDKSEEDQLSLVLSRLLPGWKALYDREIDRMVKQFGVSRLDAAKQILERQESVGWDYAERQQE